MRYPLFVRRYAELKGCFLFFSAFNNFLGETVAPVEEIVTPEEGLEKLADLKKAVGLSR